jgi:uncharacterized protein YndB with AHSA1/START domain
MNDAPSAPAPGEGIEIIRVFDAPREAVWREWTEPERFADWYGGADAEVPVESVSMDVRPGGAWKATMFAGPNRDEIPWSGEYVEVSEPERLVLTVKDRPGDEYELVTVTLTELDGGRTELRMLQTGGHMDAEGYERARQGCGGFFDRMEERLGAG